MDKAIYRKLVDSLVKNKEFVTLNNGVKVEIRNCYDRISGKIDPRTYAAVSATRDDFINHPEQYDSELLANANRLFGPPAPENYSLLSQMRYTFGWRSSDLSENVITKRHVLISKYGPFSVWHYESLNKIEYSPCVIFIHGGGFVAGDIETVQNQCRLLAQLIKGTVFSVDYHLAPEYKFPAAFVDCKMTLEWVYSNADKLGIDKERIGVAGDSAGGNLSAALSIADRNEGMNIIYYQCLIYPKLSGAVSSADPYYYWNENIYDNCYNNQIISEQIHAIGDINNAIDRWYLTESTDRFTQYYSPIKAECKGLPKTLLVTAEYDFLRAECDAFAGMLKSAGVDFRAIRYGGIFHGTFDRLGYAPQVEDIIMEIAKDMCK